MLEILGEDRERIEELHREIKKEQERIAIRSLIATQKALMMLDPKRCARLPQRP